MTTRKALDGFVSPDSPLSPRRAFRKLPTLSRPLVAYDPEPLWEQDTRSLPASLRRARRRIRAFAEKELAPRAPALDLSPHAAAGDEPAAISELLRAAGRAGLLTDLLPRPIGSGGPAQFRHPLAWYHAIRCEELAAADGGLMLLLSAPHLGAAPLVISGSPGTVRRFLVPAYRATEQGDPHLFAYAITEPGAGSDAEDGYGASLATPGTAARRVPGGWSISGRKVFISGGDIAKSVTVFAALEGEGFDSWTCFLVTRDMPGFSVARTELKMGMRASSAAELVFDDVVVPEDHVIGGLRNGWALNRAVLNTSRIPVGGMAVGLARAAIEAAVDFATRNSLGGKELIHFQEVQLAISEMISRTAASRSLVWRAAAHGMAARQDLASMAKGHATDTAVAVATLAMDLLGNHGMLHANRVERIYRDARLTQIFEGTNEINRLSILEDHQTELLARINGTQEQR